MKRDPGLRGLSDDHHRALVLARHAVRAATGLGSRPVEDVWGEVERSFEEELAPHFEIEERLLLPALEQQDEHQLTARVRSDHDLLRNLVHDEERPVRDRLAEFGAVLRDHVRFEERTLFAVAQEKLPRQVLDAVADACPKMSAMKTQRERPAGHEP